MFSDYQEFGWEFIERRYMPTGFIERYFDYMKVMKHLATKIAKGKAKDTEFEQKVHGKTQSFRPKGKRHITYTALHDTIQLPPGAEDETFD